MSAGVSGIKRKSHRSEVPEITAWRRRESSDDVGRVWQKKKEILPSCFCSTAACIALATAALSSAVCLLLSHPQLYIYNCISICLIYNCLLLLAAMYQQGRTKKVCKEKLSLVDVERNGGR